MAAIEIRGLRKAFGDTRALDGLDLSGSSGEILGIAGPNGAGKSTLISILAGELEADEGEILIDGEKLSPQLSAERVAVVHQEPQVFPNLTVGENLLVGRETERASRPQLSEVERRMLEELEIVEFVDWPLDRCTLAVRQRTEIARALVRDARCMLFDEPNSALTDEESAQLFRHMRSLASSGHIVILVTHRLAELVSIAARVVVIRDGRNAALLEGDELTQEAVAAELVVGRAHRDGSDGTTERPLANSGDAASALSLRQWTHTAAAFSDASLDVAEGEIIALVGVEGAGARELLRSVAGVEPATGTIAIGRFTGHQAIVAKTGYVAPDRRASLFPNLSVGQNVIVRLGNPGIANSIGLLKRRKLQGLAKSSVEQFAIRCQSADQPINDLSGGNQQKVAIAAAITQRPHVLALEEPTRGVDIGSKGEIYQILREYAAQGNAVLIYCTEVSEVFEVADRVHVVSNGHLSPSLNVRQFTDVEALARHVTGLERQGLSVSPVPV